MSFFQEPLTDFLELEIIQFLHHTGPLACTCKNGRDLASTKGTGTCCPTQQFHHPEGARLTADVIEECEYDEDDRLQLYDGDEEDKKDMMNPWQLEQCEELLWECCNSHYFSTGCIPNCNVTPEKVSAAMEANKREQVSPGGDDSTISDDSEVCEGPTSDWCWDKSISGDESISGDAKRSCVPDAHVESWL